MLLPLVAAAELAYLAGLALPRASGRDRREGAGSGEGPEGEAPHRGAAVARRRMLGSWRGRRSRFLRLRARCVEMRGSRTRSAASGDSGGSAKEFRTPGLDRLLWVFLRLLLAQQAIERFLQADDRHEKPVGLEGRARLEGGGGAAPAQGTTGSCAR